MVVVVVVVVVVGYVGGYVAVTLTRLPRSQPQRVRVVRHGIEVRKQCLVNNRRTILIVICIVP